MDLRLESHASLKIQFAAGQCAAVCEIIEALAALDDAYRGLFRWSRLIDTALEGGLAVPGSELNPGADHNLCLVAIETVSPAQLEVVALLQPIARIRAYLSRPSGGVIINATEGDGERQQILAEAEWLGADVARLERAGLSQTRINMALDDLFSHFIRLNSCPRIRLPEQDR